MQDRIRNLEELTSQKAQLYHILEMYLEIFPALDSYLFRYSPLEYLGEGIISLTSSGFGNIREIRDDIQTLPLIYSAIREKRAKYSTGKEYFLHHASSKYAGRFCQDSLAVTPLCLGNVVIGYICSTNFVKGAIVDEKMLDCLSQFGKLVGWALDESDVVEDNILLSRRELEVMKRIARGESTKEMANYMEISEVTVKQYVKTAMKKLGAHNRAHAVAQLFHMGVFKAKG